MRASVRVSAGLPCISALVKYSATRPGWPFAGGLQCGQTALRVVTRNRQVRLLRIEPAKANRRPQDTFDLFINGGDGDFTVLDRRQEIRPVHEFSGWHLQIEAAVCRRDCIV